MDVPPDVILPSMLAGVWGSSTVSTTSVLSYSSPSTSDAWEQMTACRHDSDMGLATSSACRRAGQTRKSANVALGPPAFFAPGAPVDLLTALGGLLGPVGLMLLGSSSRALWVIVAGTSLDGLWEEFAGAGARPLLSDQQTHRMRYCSLATFDLSGTWLDCGVDIVAKERYRFLTSMRELRREGLARTFEAVSQLESQELKLSTGTLNGATYFCTERFVHEHTGAVIAPLMNIAKGVLDLKDPGRPLIAGTWEQWEVPPRELRGLALAVSGEPPAGAIQLTSSGSFEFTRISRIFDERAWQNPDLRERAGLGRTGEFYVVEPL